MDRTLLKNVSSLLLLQGTNYLFPLLTLPYLVRVLGPSDYGRVGFAASLVQYFVLLTDFGFNLSATKSIAGGRSDKRLVSETFWSVMVAKLALCVLGFIILFIAITTIPRLAEERWLLIATYVAAFGTVLFPVWLFQGLERMGIVTACTVAAKAMVVPAIFLLVRTPADLIVVAALQSGSGLLAGAVSLGLVYRDKLVDWAPPSVAGVLDALTNSWPLFLSVAAISLYTNSNVVLLGFLTGNAAVGQFVAADKLRQAVQALINPISQSVYPRICSMMADAPDHAFHLIRRLLAVQGLVMLAVSILMYLLSDVIAQLVLGSKFPGASETLRILAFLPFVIGLSNIFGIQTMLPLGMLTTFRNVLIGSGLLNLFLLVPLGRLYGANGAAAAILITEVVVTVLMFAILLYRRIPIIPIPAGRTS